MHWFILPFHSYDIHFLPQYRKFLQSLPDRGKKVTETVAKLRELITRKEQLEDTVAQFERMTVSRLVQRTRRDVLDSDDSDDDMSGAGNQAFMNSTKDKHVGSGVGPNLHKKTESKLNKTVDCNKLEQKHTGQSLGGKWDYESSATPPAYNLEVLVDFVAFAVCAVKSSYNT